MYGTHRIVRTYDDFGNVTSYTGYGTDGKLAPYDQYGEAKALYRYDDMGRVVYAEYFDKESMPLSNPERTCSYKNEYADDGSTKTIKWTWKDGHLDTLYYKHSTKDWIYTKYTDNIVEIDSLSQSGYIRDEAYYDYSMNPISLKDLGFTTTPYHRKRTVERSKGKYIEYVTECWDANNEYTGQYPFSILIRDTTSHHEFRRYYDSELRLADTYIQDYSSNWQLSSQSDVNAFGVICRAGGDASVRLYSADIFYSQKGEYASFIAKDEFGEPDYISSSSVVYYYQRISKKGGNKFYDVNNNEITDFDNFRNECPKAMSIEVTDSSAYGLGLKDNDIILRYGDSYQMEDSLNYHDFVGAWSLAQCMEAPREKRLLLFRINPDTKEYGVVSLTLPKGNPSQLGFIAHSTYKTPKQRMRIQESITAYCKQCSDNGTTCLWNTNIAPSDKNKSIVVAFPEMYRANRYKPYPLQITDPSIILAYNVPTISKCWSFGQNAESLDNIIAFRKNSQIVHPFDMYCLKKGNSFEKHNFTDILIGFDFFDYKVSKSQYEYLEKQYKLAEKQIKKEMHK